MSTLPFSKAHLDQLKAFIDVCKKQPELLEHSELLFFKQYILSLGGKIPPVRAAGDSPKKQDPKVPETKVDEEPENDVGEEESDIELDNTGVIEPDRDDPQPMGDKDKEASEEDIDKSNGLKREAISSFALGEFEKAIKLYTEAILLNPGAALLYAKRGQAYLALNKPNACIRDCERALEINPDSATAYKFRGRANRLLGHWEEAARDLRNACKIDFDEQADEWLREVTPNARRLEEHQRKYERIRAERDVKQRLDRARKAREQHARAAAAAAAQNQAAQEDGTAAAGAGGTDAGMGDFFKLLNDPDILAAFQDLEVAAAFQDISANPANIIKYRSNPKVAAVINKLATKFGDMGGGLGGLGGLGGFPGGFPGGGFGAPPPGPAPSAPGGDDVGLD